MLDGCEMKLRDVYRIFVPSKLTSGKPLCGSPALALREWRKLPTWGESSSNM